VSDRARPADRAHSDPCPFGSASSPDAAA
jgi:hypothetical protein